MRFGCAGNAPASGYDDLLTEFGQPAQSHRRQPILALVFVAFTGLCGCAPAPLVVPASTVGTVPPNLALASLGPGSPPVLLVLQKSYANATRQDIILSTAGKTPGENTLRVDVYGTSSDSVSPETILTDRPLSDTDVIAEFADALPGVPLQRSQADVQNTYGPFGYVTGKSAEGDACIYAWQRIATPDRDISLFNRRVAMSIRLRYCQTDASEAALVAPMMRLQIKVSPSGGNWAAEPPYLSPGLGTPGASFRPSLIQTKIEAKPAPSKPRRAPRHVAAPARPAAAPVAPPPPASGPIVPPPPDVGAPAGIPVAPSQPGAQP